MHFKLIIAMVQDDQTEAVLDITREAGATGATIINNVRGEGLKSKKSFFGLSIDAQRDLILFVVEEHLSRTVIESIETILVQGEKTVGIALQIDVDDLIGAARQINKLTKIVEEEI